MHYSEVNMREPLHPDRWVKLAEQTATLRDPEQWLRDQFDEIEKEYKQAIIENEAYKAANPNRGRIGTDQRLWRIEFSYRQNKAGIDVAIYRIRRKRALLDPTYTYRKNIMEFKRICDVKKNTSSIEKYADFLLEAEEKYRGFWEYSLYVNTPVGLQPMDEKIEEIVNYIQAELDALGQTSTDNPDKCEAIKIALGKYGFFDLMKVRAISPAKVENLINKMAVAGNPYTIAMFEHLGFNEHLFINHCDSTKYRQSEKLAEILGCSPDTAKGNVSALSPKATVNTKAKNSSWKHKEQVQKDYEALK
jgi:hypothetical protein